jgi:CBS domain containing-hemolysin-like protein
MARFVVFPILLTDRVLAPIRAGLLGLTHVLFQLTRFHEIKAAPFITDEEFKSALTDGEAQGVIEEDERQMIQGILEFSDALLREILVPRPDVVALPDDATVRDALAVYKEHKY